MKTVKVGVKSDRNAPRLELFVRIIWAIPTAVVICIFGMIAKLCILLNWLCILVTGKRNRTLTGVARDYLYYSTKVQAYLSLLTDERSPILPED